MSETGTTRSYNQILEHVYNKTEKGTGLKGKENCSGFVRMAAAELRIKLEGQQADDQLKYMKRHWIPLKDGMEALQKASEGYFVVAGALSGDYTPPRSNGHIVVVQPVRPAALPVGPEDLANGRWPFVWGGDKDKRLMPKGDVSLNWVIDKRAHSKIRYYMPPTPGPHTPPFQ